MSHVVIYRNRFGGPAVRGRWSHVYRLGESLCEETAHDTAAQAKRCAEAKLGLPARSKGWTQHARHSSVGGVEHRHEVPAR